MTGGILIYAADKPQLRKFALVIATLSKLVFISLVLAFGSAFLDKALLAILFDAVVVAIYLIYLFN
jgi:hypothetical protein